MTTFQILEQFCEIVQGGRHKLSGNDFVKSGYPAYGAGGMNGYLATFEFDESAVILSSIGARCGKCFYVEGRWSSLANTQVIFPDKNECDAKFLWYQLNDEKRWPRAGTGQPFIKPSDVKRQKVFLPPIEEQRRIAAILDQAETLRTQRRTALALLDSLTQSLFLDMFGDPVVNPKFALGIIREFVEANSGKSAKSVLSDQPTEIPIFGGNGINGWATESLYDHSVLVFGRVGQQCGNAFLTDGPSWVTDNAIVVQIKDAAALVPIYVLSAFRYSEFSARVKHLDLPFINQGMILDNPIVIPPITLQQTFATRIASIEALKATHRRALAALDALFASLQQRAFAGQL